MSPPAPPPSAASPALAALRNALDDVDDQLLALLARRAGVIGQIRALGDKGPVKLRPGREAAIIRRLLGQDLGDLPPQTVVRVWRELFASSLTMQGGFSLAVGGENLLPAAREHFGALTPMQVADPANILAQLINGHATIAVMPEPKSLGTWWDSAPFRAGKLHIVGRLPFWAERADGTDVTPALVISTQPPDQSGQDRALILMDRTISQANLDTSEMLWQWGNDSIIDTADSQAAVGKSGILIGLYAQPMPMSSR